MKLGNDIRGKAKVEVPLTGDDIDILLECIWRFTQMNEEGMCEYTEEALDSAKAMEKQLYFMKKDMQGEYVEKGLDKQDQGWYNPSDERIYGDW